jgi:hypothetical protein
MATLTNDQLGSYKSPPAIEAVISVHFEAPLEEKSIDAFVRRRKTEYPRSEDNVEISSSLDLSTRKAAASSRKVGRKLTSSDGGHVINFFYNQMATIQISLIQIGRICIKRHGIIGTRW